MGPSLEHRRGVGSGTAADVGDLRDAAEIEMLCDVEWVAARAGQAVHRADESLGFLGAALEHVEPARRSAGLNRLIQMRPHFKDRLIEKDHAAQVFSRRLEHELPRYGR